MIKKALEKYSEQPTFRAAIQGLLLAVDSSGAASVGESWLAGYGANLQNQRLSKLIKVIDSRLKDVEQLTVLLTDELYDLFRAASEGSVKTGSDEKIKRFANILANKVLDEESDWDDAQMALSILSGMNDLHLKILATIQSVEPYTPNSDDNSNNGLSGKQLIFMSSESLVSSESAKRSTIVKLLPEYTQVLLEVACANLSSKGFLFDELTTLYGDGKPIYSLTNSGEWFIKWISEYKFQ